MAEIVGPAILSPIYGVVSLPKPARHHHVIKKIVDDGLAGYVGGDDIQGFITDEGKFLDRQDALKVAKAANQLIRKTHPEYLLFSEDLW